MFSDTLVRCAALAQPSGPVRRLTVAVNPRLVVVACTDGYRAYRAAFTRESCGDGLPPVGIYTADTEDLPTFGSSHWTADLEGTAVRFTCYTAGGKRTTATRKRDTFTPLHERPSDLLRVWAGIQPRESLELPADATRLLSDALEVLHTGENIYISRGRIVAGPLSAELFDAPKDLPPICLSVDYLEGALEFAGPDAVIHVPTTKGDPLEIRSESFRALVMGIA